MLPSRMPSSCLPVNWILLPCAPNGLTTYENRLWTWLDTENNPKESLQWTRMWIWRRRCRWRNHAMKFALVSSRPVPIKHTLKRISEFQRMIWWIDWSLYGLFDWLIDWLLDWLISLSLVRSFDWLIDCWIDWSLYRLFDWLIDWLIAVTPLSWMKSIARVVHNIDSEHRTVLMPLKLSHFRKWEGISKTGKTQ